MNGSHTNYERLVATEVLKGKREGIGRLPVFGRARIALRGTKVAGRMSR